MTERPRRTMAELTAMADEFLKDHQLGVLATGRRDGSPQQTILSYRFNGREFFMTTGADTAKVKNIRKRPGVSFAVSEGPTCVVVYGTARLLQGAEAEARMSDAPPVGLPRGTVTLITFTPEMYRWARIEG